MKIINAGIRKHNIISKVGSPSLSKSERLNLDQSDIITSILIASEKVWALKKTQAIVTKLKVIKTWISIVAKPSEKGQLFLKT